MGAHCLKTLYYRCCLWLPGTFQACRSRTALRCSRPCSQATRVHHRCSSGCSALETARCSSCTSGAPLARLRSSWPSHLMPTLQRARPSPWSLKRCVTGSCACWMLMARMQPAMVGQSRLQRSPRQSTWLLPCPRHLTFGGRWRCRFRACLRTAASLWMRSRSWSSSGSVAPSHGNTVLPSQSHPTRRHVIRTCVASPTGCPCFYMCTMFRRRTESTG
mmetsp:Transcript_116661/g.325094  ORF Transcript_116661/g.325094 Transcript_116661/m.325094 type:complete len:218 (-) Transcript_116661:593-1246(-)